MASAFSLPADYWSKLQITKQDVESLNTYLFEAETPLTAHDLTSMFVTARVRAEKQAQAAKRQAGGKTYLPKDKYQTGDELVFPALDWIKGNVSATRAGVNPEATNFDVITVGMEDGSQRMFAAGLAEHALNQETSSANEEDDLNPEAVLEDFGSEIEKKLDTAFSQDDGLVNIAGRWFPSGLLVDINEGQLNLAEAVLDMAQGEPQPTSALLKDVELPAGINLKLAEFSLNHALLEDERFDQVGPAGQILWCLPW